jgi:hypothetical protein
MRTVGPRLAAGLIAAGLVLAGCGGSAEPKPLPAPSKSPSPSASPSDVPARPVLPEAAKAKTKAGAIAFTSAFIDTLNYSGTSGETAPLRELFLPLCTRCEAIADGIDETYASGGYFKGGEWTPERFKFYDMQNDVAVLDAIVDYRAQVWLKATGAKPIQYRASSNNLKAFNLRWQAGAWHVSALDPSA